MLDTAIDEMVDRGVTRRNACKAVGRPRASHYLAKQEPIHGPPSPRPRSHRALAEHEIDDIISVLTSERFCDQAPAQIWATLLDEGTYLASVSTMYRELRKRSLVRERRAQARRPAHIKPELVATAPNEVWSWDITKLAGPQKWTWYQLYVILDVYSRYAVNWLVAPRESDRLAEELIADAIYRHEVPDGQLALHADRGSSMTSKTVSQLLADLGVLQSHSRPHVSNDNPYSEAQFKTLKYSPRFPKRFTSLAQCRAFINDFFDHYNNQHRHSGIGLHTPADVHYRRDDKIREQRQAVLNAAYTANPARFRHRQPQPPKLPDQAWINQPQREALIHTN